MSFDLLKLDLASIDLSKMNVKQLTNIKVISIAVLIVIGIVDIVVVLPMTKNITKANTEQLKQAEEVGLASNLLLKEVEVARAQLLSLEKVDDLFDKLSDLAKQNNLDVKLNNQLGLVKVDAKNRNDKNDKKYIRRILSLEIAGSFKDLGVFLSDVHQMQDAILEINLINVMRKSKDPAKVQANINYVLYALKDEENQS